MVEFCDILLLSGSRILRMNDAPGKAAYPAGALVNELQPNGGSIMIFSSEVDPFSGSLSDSSTFDDDGKGCDVSTLEPMCTL